MIFTLHVAGEGEESYIREIKKLLRQRSHIDRVIFHGRVPFGKDLFDLYREAHAFVLPSYTEGFPRVVWEAALFSTPIVATQVGGIPIILKDRKHAFLVKPRDEKSLYEALVCLLKNIDRSKRIAESAYHLAMGNTLEPSIELLANTIKE